MDVFFNSRKIKFDVLHKLLLTHMRRERVYKVNVFINLDDIFHKLHNPILDRRMSVSNSNTIVQLTSNIINLAAHYREYMMREGWNPKIFLYYTSSTKGPFRNTIYRESYRNHFIQINSETNQKTPHLNMALPGAISLTKSIVQYIEGVYMIDSSFIEPSVLPMAISNSVFSDYNFIITRDPYDYQYVTQNKWMIVYADSEEERSTVITPSNIWRFVAEREKMSVSEYSLDYQASLYPFALSINGDTYRGIPRIRKCGWKSILKIIDELSKEPVALTSVTLRERTVDRLRGDNKVSLEDINRNLSCTDIQLQYQRLNLNANHAFNADLMMQMTDVPDSENLLTVDRIYFGNHHLNIPFLTKQMPGNSKYVGKFNLEGKGE